MTEPIRILLVEDDEDDITFFELALKKQAMATQLTTLTDGDQVMPYLVSDQRERPNLLVLDLNLPKLPGREVLTQLKNQPTLQKIPVVILTTSSAQEDNDFCIANGASRFLTKPTSLTALSSMIADVLTVAEK